MKEPCKKCLPLENQIVKTDEAQCLSCYLPHKIIKLLSTDECCVFEHKIKYMKGFIVYLDVIGFTAIVVGNLNKNKDITTVSDTLSEFYSIIIEIIQGAGGSVYQFAGDSLVISFEQLDNESVMDNFKRTFYAMTSVIDICDNFNSVHNESFNLRPKIGIGTGKYYQYLLGSRNSFITPIIAGNAIQEALLCEKQCTKQEIVISTKVFDIAKETEIKDCFENINNFYHLTKNTKNFGAEASLPDIVSIDEMNKNPFFFNRIRAFINPIILQNVRNKIQGFSGDYKNITCLMARFDITVKIDDTKETVEIFYEQLNSIYTLMQAKASRYNAYCTKPDISDKGIVFLVFFGTPIVIENTERSAMLCAEEIICASKKTTFIKSTNIGITTGKVYCGEFGGYMRKDFTSIGNSINLASRLMTAFVGRNDFSILMDIATTNAVSSYVKVQTVSGIECKGYEKPQDASYLIGINKDALDSNTTKQIIGRDSQLNILMSLFESTINNTINFAFITGEAGSGKSFLAKKFAKKASQKYRNLRILTGKMYQYESSTAFFCWRFIIKQLMDIPDDLPDTMIPDLVEAYFKEHMPDDLIWISFLLNMLGFNLEENPETSEIDISVKQQTFFLLILRIIDSAVHTNPLIIILDDIQWFDEVSQKMLQFLLETRVLSNVFCLFIARESAFIKSFFNCQDVKTVSLEPLSNENSIILSRNLLNLDENNLELENRIATISGGNPLFIENIVQNLIENKTIIKGCNKKNIFSSDSKDINNIIIPTSIQNIILSRLTALGFEEQVVCKTASVIGRTFSTDILSLLLSEEIKPERIVQMLENVEKHKLIICEKIRIAYSFKNIVIHDVIYNTILENTKRELNKMILLYLEDKYKTNISIISERLLYHAKEAKDTQKIFTYAILSAQKAEKTFATKDAAIFYNTALDEMQNFPTSSQNQILKFQLQLALAEVYRTSGEYQLTYDLLTSVLKNSTLKQIRAEAYKGLGRYYQEQGKFDKAVEMLENALHILGHKVPKKLITTYISIAKNALRQFFIYGIAKGKILQYKNKRLEKAKTISDILCVLSKLYYFGLTEKIAWSAIENINNVFHFNKDYSRFCLAIGDYAMALVSAGFVKLGRIFYKKGLSIIEKQELNSTTLNIFNSRYAYNFLLLDEPYKSIKLLENATAHFRKSGELWELMSATGALAQNYFLVGDYEKSRFFYEEAKNIAEKLHSTLHIGWALNKVPFIDYLTGKCSAQEAEEKLKEGINLSESVHDHMTLCIHYGHLANIFTKEKDFEKSLFYAKQIMHENKVYKINIPHVKISYVDVVETIFAAFIANKISSSEKNKYEKMAKNALSKLQKLSKKNTMLKGPTLRAAAEFALLKNNKPEMEKYLIESINLLKDSPYKEEYKTSQKLAKLYNIKI